MKSLLKLFSVLLTIFVIGTATTPALHAQNEEAPEASREATGGAQTLEDILRRQRGEDVPLDQGEAGPADNPDGLPGALATRGGASDSSLWRAVRQGQDGVFTSSARDPNATMLVQDEGEKWLAARNGPLLKYTGYAFGGMLLLLVLFRLIRGRIMIEGGRAGVRVKRFGFIERFAHWMLAISFIILAVTGFGLLAGRDVVIPALDYLNVKFTHSAGVVDPNYGKNTFASLIGAGKWAHNNLSWAFMISLVMIFVLWVFRNIPTWTDVKWFLQAGGLFSKNKHPSARKFNGGQKLIFWSVILFGASLSASGLMLLLPYEFTMFAPTFETLNSAGELVGYAPNLATETTPLQEQQYAQSWHTIIGIVLTTIIIAHIYIGSVGMQGAFSAMGSGKVDLNWANEHHNLWIEKLEENGEMVNADTGDEIYYTQSHAHPAE